MIEVTIQDKELAQAAQSGSDTFLQLVIDKTREAIGGELTAENMPRMSSNQITLIGYATLREEVMDGGFVQMIHNGYGPFYFRNPFDAAVRNWGATDLCRLMRRAKKQYIRHHEDIEKEMTDVEFMAIYETMQVFDDFDDEFVTNEEQWTDTIAHYVDEHLDEFVTIVD